MKVITLILLSLSLMILASCSYFEEPEIPTGLTAVYNATEDAIEVSWDDVDGAREYSVYRGSTPDDLEEIHTGDNGSWNDYDYNYYERYYAVEAKNDVGESGLSEAVEAELPATDQYEDDNSLANASTIVLTGDAPSQKHSIMPVGDVDFIKFHAAPPYGYNIEVPAISAFPLKLTLLDVNGNELATDNDGEGDYIARIGEWAPTTAGDYYIKVEAKVASEEGYYRIFFHEWE